MLIGRRKVSQKVVPPHYVFFSLMLLRTSHGVFPSMKYNITRLLHNRIMAPNKQEIGIKVVITNVLAYLEL